MSEEWKGKHYSYFQNRECEFFPCHKTEKTDDFSCLFCYCPLYALGENCGGNFSYTEGGFKDCSNCLIPHRADNYGRITGRYADVAELAKKK